MGVTLDLTGDSGIWIQRDGVTLTVNGTVNAPSNRIGFDTGSGARTMNINGNGTINLTGKGSLLIVWSGDGVSRKLTLEGVTLAGLPDNDEPLVGVYEGAELVMVSGAIRGNGGGSVRTGQGTFTMLGGFVEGREIPFTLVANSPFGKNVSGGVAYGNGRFVAVSWLYNEGARYGEIAYSTDGITWTKVANTPSGFNFSSIAFSNGKFFVFGWPGYMASSTDGENWTVVISNLREDINGIAYGGGRWVIVLYDGRIMYSTDGVTWTAATARPSGWQYVSVTYGNGRFFAGAMGDRLAQSTDGVTWTAVAKSTILTNISFLGGRFFLYSGMDNFSLEHSTDGISWTVVEDTTFGNSHIRDIAYGGGKFVLVGNEGKAAYSADGVTWTAVELGLNDDISAIAYGAGRFVIMAREDSSIMAYSNVLE